jgi:Holliday junction resolvase RusA-like endonuclease
MRLRKPIDAETEQLNRLTDLITCMDSIRGYRRRSSVALGDKFGALKGRAASQANKIWKEVKPDVDRIVDMPLQIPGIPTMIRMNHYLRISSRIFLIFFAIIVGAFFVPAYRPYLGLFRELWFFSFVILGLVITTYGAIALDYRIRRKVVQFEKETIDRYEKNVQKIARACQRLIDLLRDEIRRTRKDPYDFPIRLFYDDYDGIQIIDSFNPRIMLFFKQKFKVYVAIVSV